MTQQHECGDWTKWSTQARKAAKAAGVGSTTANRASAPNGAPKPEPTGRQVLQM